MTLQERKKIKLQVIMNSIRASLKKGNEVDEYKLIAITMMELGSAKRTVLEYLTQLELTDKIVRSNGKILIPGITINENEKEPNSPTEALRASVRKFEARKGKKRAYKSDGNRKLGEFK